MSRTASTLLLAAASLFLGIPMTAAGDDIMSYLVEMTLDEAESPVPFLSLRSICDNPLQGSEFPYVILGSYRQRVAAPLRPVILLWDGNPPTSGQTLAFKNIGALRTVFAAENVSHGDNYEVRKLIVFGDKYIYCGYRESAPSTSFVHILKATFAQDSSLKPFPGESHFREFSLQTDVGSKKLSTQAAGLKCSLNQDDDANIFLQFVVAGTYDNFGQPHEPHERPFLYKFSAKQSSPLPSVLESTCRINNPFFSAGVQRVQIGDIEGDYVIGRTFMGTASASESQLRRHGLIAKHNDDNTTFPSLIGQGQSPGSTHCGFNGMFATYVVGEWGERAVVYDIGASAAESPLTISGEANTSLFDGVVINSIDRTWIAVGQALDGANYKGLILLKTKK